MYESENAAARFGQELLRTRSEFFAGIQAKKDQALEADRQRQIEAKMDPAAKAMLYQARALRQASENYAASKAPEPVPLKYSATRDEDYAQRIEASRAANRARFQPVHRSGWGE